MADTLDYKLGFTFRGSVPNHVNSREFGNGSPGAVVSPDMQTLFVSYCEYEEWTGCVFVYRKTNSGYQLDRTLEIPIPSNSDYADFGWSICVSEDGSTVVIGADGWGYAPDNYPGACFVFDSALNFKQIIIPQNATSSSYYGSGIALDYSGDTLAIGGEDGVAIYRRVNGVYQYAYTVSSNYSFLYISPDGSRMVSGESVYRLGSLNYETEFTFPVEPSWNDIQNTRIWSLKPNYGLDVIVSNQSDHSSAVYKRVGAAWSKVAGPVTYPGGISGTDYGHGVPIQHGDAILACGNQGENGRVFGGANYTTLLHESLAASPELDLTLPWSQEVIQLFSAAGDAPVVLYGRIIALIPHHYVEGITPGVYVYATGGRFFRGFVNSTEV